MINQTKQTEQSKRQNTAYLALAIVNGILLTGSAVFWLYSFISSLVREIFTVNWLIIIPLLFLIAYLVTVYAIIWIRTKKQIMSNPVFCQICLLSSICMLAVTMIALMGFSFLYGWWEYRPGGAYGIPIAVLFIIDFIATMLLSCAILAFVVFSKKDVGKRLKIIIYILLIALPFLI